MKNGKQGWSVKHLPCLFKFLILCSSTKKIKFHTPKKVVHIRKCQLMNAENEKFKTSLFGTPDKMDLSNDY